MNVIRSSEVMQGNEDLFASQSSALNMPSGTSSTNDAHEDQHVSPFSPSSPTLTPFPPPPKLRRSYGYDDAARDFTVANRLHDEMMERIADWNLVKALRICRDVTEHKKRETYDVGPRLVHISPLYEWDDEHILVAIKQYNSAMSFFSSFRDKRAVAYFLSGFFLCLCMLALYPPEVSFFLVTVLFTPYNLLCQVPFSLSQLSPVFFLKEILRPTNLQRLSSSFPVYYDYVSRVPIPGAGGFMLYWTGLCAPVVEEFIKHYVPLGYMMPFLEYSMYLTQGANPYMRLAPLLMHCVGLCMPPLFSLLLHIWWNFCSLSLVNDDTFPILQTIQSYIWSPIPMAISYTFGTLAPSESFQWMGASMLSDAAVCRLLGNKRVAERSAFPGTPDPVVWAPFKYNGKFDNPGLSRGRLAPVVQYCTKGPRGGGYSPYWEVSSERVDLSKYIHVDGYLPELDPDRDNPCAHWVEPYKGPLNRSERRVKTPRRNFSGGGPLDELPSVTERRVAKHKVRTLLSAEEKQFLRLKRCLARDSKRLEHRDRALIDKVLASKYAGELLAVARPPIVPEGWSTVQSAMDYPDVDVTVPHQVYDAMMASLPPILGQSFQKLPYPVFLSVVNFLKSRDVFGALVSLELVSCSILGAQMAPDLKSELVRCIKITSALIALNGVKDLGVAFMESRFEPEGFTEYSNMFSRFSSSPLVVKLVAVVLAFLPALAKAESSIFGKALLSTALDWLLNWRETFGASPFGILADFCTFIMGRIELFARTHNWGDLFGSSPQVEWLDEADRLTKELDQARSKPGEHVPKVVCTKAKAHVAKALRFKEPLIGSRARTLASESDRLEKALLNERKPPLGIIMTGPPGIGKTSLVSLVAKIYKQSNGIDDDLNVVYSWSNDKYQSPNAVSCIINVNDAFQIKDEYSDTGLDTYQSLVDSFALQVSGAAVDEKNVILTPDIVFVSTNASEYQFSKSKGGANKLDRRYMIVEFSWSLKCTAIAEEEGIPCSEVFKRSKEKDLVFYRLGYMDNTDNKNKMDMSIKRELDPPCSTLRIEDVLIRIIEMEKNRPDVLAPTDILDFNNVCSHRYPCNSVCGCWKDGKLIVKDDVVVVDRPPPDDGAKIDRWEAEGFTFVPEGEIPVDMSYWIMAAASLFAMISILLTGKPPALTVQHKVMVPEKVSYILAAPAALAFLALAARWFRSLSAEGLIHSTPSVPPPPPTERVRTNLTTHAPYIGTTAASYQARIEGPLFTMNAIVLNPDLLAVPKHFFVYAGKKAQQGDIVTITYKNKQSFWKVDWPHVWLHPDRDLAFVSVNNLDGVAGTAFKLLPEKECTPPGLCNLGTNVGIRVDSHMEYIAETAPGDCGLAITDQTNTMVFGFHTGKKISAFGRVSKVGEPLSKELVRRCLQELKARDVLVNIFSDELPDAVANQKVAEGAYPHGDAGWYGREKPLDHVDHVPLGHKTVYHKPKFSACKTTLFEEFGAECKEYGKPHDGRAVKLPDGRWQSAETIRLDACDHGNVNIDHATMMRAVNAYVDQLPITEQDKCTPLSDYTAWCGSDANVLINGVDVSKSHGATLQELGFKKEEVFKDLGDNRYEIHPVLLQMCEKFEAELAGDGPLPMPYIRAVAKDEVYPSAKAALGRRRYFFLQDRACNHVMRKYLQPLLAYLLEHPLETHIIGTVNAGSAQWKEVFKEITKFGRLVTDGDQNSMDTRHRALMKYYCIVLKKVAHKLGYDAHGLHMVERILASLSRYCLEMEGDFFVCFSGLVSGRADTLVCNSICLILIFYYALFSRMPADETRTVRELIALLVTGDDSAMNCHDSIRSWYNGKVVAEVASELGYVMTAGNKSDVIDWVDISSIQYLKRGFREEGDYVWAPLAKDSIFKALSYATGIKDPNKMRERDRAASHSAVREGFLHGREFMDDLVSRLSKHFPDELYPSYDELKTDYDGGIFEAWVNTHTKTAPYHRGDHSEVVVEGLPPTRNVVYPMGDCASPECPIPFRGAFKDFPVHTNSTMHRDIPVVLSTLPSELNPTTSDISVLTGADSQIQKFPDPASETTIYNTYDRRRCPPPMEGLHDILRVPRLISHPTTSVFGTQTSIDPFTKLKAVSLAFKQSLSPFAAIRADIGIRVKYTGSSSLMGAQRIVFAPVSIGQDIDQYNVNANTSWGENRTLDIIQTSSLPHFDLDISCTMDKTILLPYIGHTDMTVNQATASEWWTIESVPLNAIRSVNGITPPEVKYEVWAWLENVEVDILVPEGEMSSGPLSRGLAYASYIASIAGQYVSTFEKIAAFGATAAQKFGLARATEPQDGVVLSRSRTNGHYMSGEPDYSSVLGSSPFMLRDVSAVRGGEDETVTSIGRKWCQIVSEATSGTSYFVHPEIFVATYPYMRPSNLGWLSMMFENWTGELDMKLQVLSSPLLRGRIGVNIYPPGFAPSATFRTDGSVLAFEFDVEGSTEFIFTVPYLFRKPVMTFPLNTPVAGNNGTKFRFFFLSDFVGPSATTVYPSVNIWMRGGDDFAFITPCLDEAQGFTFAPEGHKANAVARSGEFVDNLKELATRKSPMCTIETSTFQLPADGTFPNTSWEVEPANAFLPMWTFDTFIRQAFWGFTGGTRYTIEPCEGLVDDPMYVGTSLAIPWSTALSPPQFMTRGYVTHTVPSTSSCDVIVPDRSFVPYKFSTPDLIGAGQYVECLTVTANASVAGTTTIWSSAGEDRTFFLYKGPPRLRWPV